MNTSRLGRGELIAGVSGLALLIVLWFDWYGVEGLPGGASAWESFTFIDIILFVTAVTAAGLAAATSMSRNVGLPVAGSALTAGLGILSLILVAYRLLNTPDFGNDLLEVDTTRKLGVWLGLFAAGGVAYGGYVGMQEEGTSFSEQADRLQARDDAPPPPPPPPAAGGTGAPPTV